MLIVITLMVVCGTAIVKKGLKDMVSTLPVITAMIILMPIRAKINLGFIDLNMQRLFVLLLILLYLLYTQTEENNSIIKSWLDVPFIYLIILNIIILCISTIFSVNFMVSLKNILMSTAEFFIIYIIFCRLINTPEDVEKIFQSIYISVIILAVFAVIESYTEWNPVTYLPSDGGRFGDNGIDIDRGFRPKGVFPASQLLGMTMVLGMTFSCSILACEENLSWKTNIVWMFLPVMGLSLYKTISRGPWVAILVSYFLLFIVSSNKIRKTILIFGGFTGLFIMTNNGVYETIHRIVVQSFDTNTNIGASYEYRNALMDVAIEALSKNSLRTFFGYGPETFFYLNLQRDFLGMHYTFLSCDSSWIQSAIETGLIGFSVLSLLLFSIFLFQIFSIKKLSGKLKNMMVCIVAFNGSFLFLMSNVAIYGWVQYGHIYWILAALSIMIVKIHDSDENRSDGNIMNEISTLETL